MPLFEITFWELCAVLGLVQTVYLLVYLSVRARHVRHILIPGGCFLLLAGGFLADFGLRYIGTGPFYWFLQTFLWLMIAPFSVLLIVQILKIGEFPERKYWLSVAFPLVAILSGWGVGALRTDCGLWELCALTLREQAVSIFGGIAGGLCFLMLWAGRGGFANPEVEKSQKQDRYWLAISLLIVNLGLLGLTTWQGALELSFERFLLIRDVLGGAMVYLASTGLLRIYPQSVKVLKVVETNRDVFSHEEKELVEKLEDLIDLQKVYQEPAYSRADLARELKTSEATVSRLVNVHFGKTVPQLLNERRVRDAERLLAQTGVPVAVIAEQVGFNSLASFNRSFKEITGHSPSDSRQKKA